MKKFFTLIAAVAMAASMNAQDVVKTFTETTVFITNKANVEAAVAEGWAAAGITAASKSGSVDPSTGVEGEDGSYKGEGIMLKKDNKSKVLTIKVKGVEEIVAYGATASSGETRRLRVVAISEGDGSESWGDAPTEPKKSAVLNLTLDEEETYTVTFEGVKVDDLTAGADVALHGIKFIVPTSDDPSTGIKNIETSASAKSGKAFNLAGQQVSSSYKGLVIKDGKKYVK